MIRLAIGAGLLAFAAVPAQAETTVDWLHIEAV